MFIKYFLNLAIMAKALPHLLSGVVVTIKVGLAVIALGFTVGLFLSVVRVLIRKVPIVGIVINVLIKLYVDLLRASPYLVLLMLVYFGLPFVGIILSAFWSAVLTFGACLSAFAEEIFRGGIEAVDRGQEEAARSLGLSRLQTMWSVILPQALRISIPPLTNRTVAITKAISLASAIALPELLKQARWTQGQYANPTPLIEAALIFILLFLPLVRLTLYLEKKWGPTT